MLILLVDDDRAILQTLASQLSELLRLHGARVATARTPVEARVLLEHVKTDRLAVVADDDLGLTWTGLDILTAVAERWPNVVRILMTTRPHDDVLAGTPGDVVHVLVDKTADIDALARTVARAIESRRDLLAA